MDPYTDPRLRHRLHQANAHRDELRAALAEYGEGDIAVIRRYTEELALIQQWIDQWPDSAMPREQVEG